VDTVQVVLEEIRPLKVGMNILSLYKFRAGETVWWCTEKGDLIKEKNPAGFTLYSQIGFFAKEPVDRMIFDYTELPFMKSTMLLDDSEKVNEFKVKIQNFTLNPHMYENSPVTVTSDTLTIRKRALEQVKVKTYQLPYSGTALKKYIQPDDWVMSTYKPLQDTGLIYARKNNNDAFLFSEYLTNYIVHLIRTLPIFVLSNSEQVFKSSLYGDYLERTVMFATYARAAGLPTRLVGGFVYLYGYFYFHAWPEIWLDEWIPVDPTLIQYPADATHIPLIEGNLNDIAGSVEELKKIDIKVLEAS
jgi:transglutaminase-like putative cysteine protease